MLETPKMQRPIDQLLTIMSKLRDKQSGCPWDIKQSFASLIGCTIEEAYEVKDAIDNQDYLALKEELGDLLFQIVFYSELGKEEGLFDFDVICQAIADKLIRRHPHVFKTESSIDTFTEAEIKQNWETIKQQERDEKLIHSKMDDIPQALPALLRAYKIQKRCQSVGFDWDNIRDVLAKVEEEIIEVKETLINEEPSDKTQEELGDLMFALVNLTRHLGYNPELTLDKANQKFMRRFRFVESVLAKDGISCQEATLDQMEKAWCEAKYDEHNKK